MNPINVFLDALRLIVRQVMRIIAKIINKASNGEITPNMVTILALLVHIPIALLISRQQFIPAAILLFIFGLFDTLDGELARLQKRVSNAGMLLDASTDRMKEIILYIGIASSFITIGDPDMAVWALAACGASVCVSYVKAKGETAVAGGNLTASEVNRLFADGLFRFEVRMAMLFFGLLFNQLKIVVIIIAVMATFTALDRLIRISRRLNV